MVPWVLFAHWGVYVYTEPTEHPRAISGSANDWEEISFPHAQWFQFELDMHTPGRYNLPEHNNQWTDLLQY